MGFKLKSIFSSIAKPVAKAIDPLLPESTKKVLDKVDAMSGNMLADGAYGKSIDGSSGSSAADATDTGRLDQATMDELSQKRLAKLGKYFTSPIGVLSGANTVNAKVFS